MKLELHSGAVKNFNEKAEILLLELVPIPSKSFNNNDSYRPDFFISGSFGEKDNQTVVKLKYSFKHNDQLIGLRDKKSYKKIVQLAEGLQRTEPLQEKVSVSLLTDLVLEWMEDKYKNISTSSMVDYVLNKSEASIQELEIWIPIAELSVQSEIKIGSVTLKTVKKEMFEYWRTVIENETENENPANASKIQIINEEQKKIQGLAVASMKVNAEPTRAFEIALGETEKSIGVLRCFSPSNFNPEKTSHCTVLGKENLERTNHLILKESNLFMICNGFVEKNIQPWIINDNQLSLFKQNGLDILSEILVQKNRTKFQEKLLDSFLLYSRNSLMTNLSDRLVYIFVALESILLKNEKESIQSNIADRMAIFIGINKDEKISIVKNFIKAYDLRSKFIHHGHTVKDLDTLNEFMLNTWMFFSKLIQNANRFNTVEQFIKSIEDTIEDKKYS